MTQKRTIGTTDIEVTTIAMGCWPIVGITSVDVTEEQSLRTLEAAFEAGITFFDTAYCYGYDGESEKMIARALGDRRGEIVIASKCGIHWGADKKQIRDARPERIFQECEESLKRLNTDYIDLYYLHALDGTTPIEETATALRTLLDKGTIRSVGVSNFHNLSDFETFHAICPISASQPHYNMLQREIEEEQLPWCRANDVSVMPYWPLMKGFLAGKLKRDHVWDPKDGRLKYPIFVGEQWDRTHDFVDKLRTIASDLNITVAQLAVAWVIHQPGLTSALCGAKRPDQIQETAEAMDVQLSDDVLKTIREAIAVRGEVASRPAVK